MQTWRRLRTCAKHGRSPYLDCQKDALLEQAHDAGPGMRASGVPIVRLQAMSSDAMAKKFFQDLDRPAEEALAAARAAQSDWHQLHALMPTGRKIAQARTLPSLTRPRASRRTSI